MSKRSIHKSPARRMVSGVSRLLTGTMAIAGGWILYSKLGINHDMDLPAAVAADREVFYSQYAGRVSYYQDQSAQGRPLVLLHSINAAASAYEMRPLFEHYRGRRPVFALDLPGYGFSEWASRVYSPELFANTINDFLEQIVKIPADVIALSLTCEFAASAALARPGLVHSLALISPTGFNPPDSGRGSQQASASGTSDMLYPIFSFPLWSRAFFDLIATRASIQYFLSKSFVSPVPDAIIDYAFASSHQPGAENVPLHFISGKLFTPDIRERVYVQLHLPTLVIYDHDPFTRFDMLPSLLEQNNDWQSVRIIPTLGLPHWDQLTQTAAALDQFWQK